jgi:ATP-binding cassette subfamily B protein
MCVWLMLLVAQALLPVGLLTLTRILVDSLIACLQKPSPWDAFQPSVPHALLFAVLLMAGEGLHGASEWVRTFQSERIQDFIRDLVHQKSVSVDLSFYDSAEFHDHLHRAREEAASRPQLLLENAGTILQNGISLAAMAGVLISYGYWFAVALLASAIPAVLVLVRTNSGFHSWWERSTNERRAAHYCDMVLTASPIAAELRLFGLGDHFRKKYQGIRAKLRAERLGLATRHATLRLIGSSAGWIVSALTAGYIVLQVLNARMTVGDLALFYQAFQRGQGVARGLLSSLGQIYNNSVFLTSLFKFLAMAPKIVNAEHPVVFPPIRKGVCFREVTFTYPGSSRPAIQNLNLYIPAGQVAAIVGANGAGKSTLLKLLCRFYNPDAGCIDIDDIDIRDIELKELRAHISVLFQLPAAFQATVRENIAVAQPDASKDDLEKAARGAGAYELIGRLPHGYETVLGRWFPEGVELSPGEWQRIALARAYLKRANILILDEPTSFMDSWSEADWMQRVRALASGRTAIIITHRFNIARRADIIHVMQDGCIVESGIHDELMRLGGLYSQSPSSLDSTPLPLRANA